MSATEPLDAGIEVREIAGEPIVREAELASCTLVIFGAAGDLTQRKLVPALYNLALDGKLADPMPVIGLSREDLTDEEFRARLRESAQSYSRRRPLDEEVWTRFARRVRYLAATFEEDAAYERLSEMLRASAEECEGCANRIFYLATPPNFFPLIIEKLAAHGLIHEPDGGAAWTRVIIEKPFGRDLESARRLNDLVRAHLAESQVFRIDHYLGKETVQNILVLRFANSIFEPLWNRKYVDHVQITAAESIGIGTRGRFYDSTGVLRDIVQNHLMQVLALCAMEPPGSFSADDVRDEKARVFRSLRPIVGADAGVDVVRGQYAGYRDEPNVSPDSRTATFAALRVQIDNWRWQGVPFFLRAGKRLADQLTEVAIHFQPIPLCLFPRQGACQIVDANVLKLRIQPDEGIALSFVAKVPGDSLEVGSVRMNMSYAAAFGKPLSEAYERLLLDCMRGDPTLFARSDEVEATWKFITPILQAWEADRSSAIPTYAAGSEGPAEAEALIGRAGRRWTRIGGKRRAQRTRA